VVDEVESIVKAIDDLKAGLHEQKKAATSSGSVGTSPESGRSESEIYAEFVRHHRRLCELVQHPNTILIDSEEFHTSLLRYLHQNSP